MVQQRTQTEKNRLPNEAAPFKEVAAKFPSEINDREPNLQPVEQAEIASNISKWLGSKICGKAC
jgi:hypothetical protein